MTEDSEEAGAKAQPETAQLKLVKPLFRKN